MSIADRFRSLTAASRWEIVRSSTLDLDVAHAQSLAFAAGRYWTSSVDEARRQGTVYGLDPDGTVHDVIEVGDQTSYHPGGMDAAEGHLWVPAAPYADIGPTLVQRVSLDDGAVETVFTVDDHLGALCSTGADIFSVGWGSRVLHRWALDGRLIASRRNPSHLLDWQDVQVVEDGLVVCGGRIRLATAPPPGELWIGGLALVSPVTMEILHEVPFPGYASSGLPATAEGFVLEELGDFLELTVLPDGGHGPMVTWRQVA